MTNILDKPFEFKPLSDGVGDARLARTPSRISYGIDYLDKATGGIRSTDFIVIGGRTGAGKTSLAKTIAQNNAVKGIRVAVFSLESEKGEFTNRILYSLFAKEYYKNYTKPISYREWIAGKYDTPYLEELCRAEISLSQNYKSIEILERGDSGASFGISDFSFQLAMIEDRTDLIILDHIHHFDTETENEIKELKETIKRMRDLCLYHEKPIIVIAHFRKADRKTAQIIPDLEEFHGSSEISKEATQVITLAPFCETTEAYLYPTLFKVCKLRIDGSVSRYVGKQYFNSQINGYEDGFTLHTLKKGGLELDDVDINSYPYWARRELEVGEVSF